MTLHDSILYVIVNNSGVVFAIDAESFTLQGALTGINSPRSLYIASEDKGYITDLYDSRINLFNPRTMTLTGHIPTPSHPSTECLIAIGNRLFVNCWSMDNTILAIDTDTDSICDSLLLEGQPRKMIADAENRLWVVTDCGADGQSTPRLYRLTTEPLSIECAITLPHKAPVDLTTDASGNTIYLLNRHLWVMPHTSEGLPSQPMIEADERLLYSLGVDPVSGDIYLSDAIDYIQAGLVFRYNRYGTLLDSFTAGIIPGSFCFKQ
jgi:DNA-binding beta-propeller fold protein YncE